MKRAVYALSIFLVLIFAVTLNAQDEENTQGNEQTETQSQGTQQNDMNMPHSQAGNMDRQATSPIMDFSSLDEDVNDQKRSELKAIAEEHASKLRSELNLDEDQTEDVREAITEYLTQYWESRVLLDKDAEDRSEHSADIANNRVELSEEIRDILDDKAQQWQSNKVDWWTSLDMASFTELQESAQTAMASGNQNNEDQNQ